MKINALLDLSVVAVETEDTVTVLLELQAPPATEAVRAQASLQVVLDRSGSMSGRPLEGAKKALQALVRRLRPTDNFGLVTFDDEAQVVVPAGALTDKARVLDQIERVEAGGMTDLSAGYLRGLRELRRVSVQGGTLLVISDGHVNGGIQDVDEFASLTAKAYTDQVVTSTLGYGQGYDETLLAAIARSGSGNHVFAENPDAAGAAIAGEVEGLLSKVTKTVSVTVRCEPSVQLLRLYNDVPAHQIEEGTVMIELGDLFSEEARKLLLKLRVPALASLGTAKVADLELGYVELPRMVEHTLTLPINVNIVPGDEAAGRVPHPTVHSEVLFQEAQDVKGRASEAFERGDVAAGTHLLAETRARLEQAMEAAPVDVVGDIRAELQDVGHMSAMTHDVGSAYMSKLTRDSYHRTNRKRGRTYRSEPRDQ